MVVYTNFQLLPANRFSRFYESNESMILSLSQIIKIIGKYISLCNSYALTRIKFTFAMDPPWEGGASATSLTAMVTGLPWQPA